jgi:hypothetical protein
VIVMLGTNDLGIVPALQVDDIAQASVRVAQALVRGATAFTPARVPQALLVSPPPLGGDGAAVAGMPTWPRPPPPACTCSMAARSRPPAGPTAFIWTASSTVGSAWPCRTGSFRSCAPDEPDPST